MNRTIPANLPSWGSDTLVRFRYQAEVTFPYCLAAALDVDGIRAVLPEHLEDIALDCGGEWRFIQVKSRNEDLGLWTLAQLLVSGGALRSLYRTFRCMNGQSCSLELLLEGAPKPRDGIQHLLPDGDRSAIVEQVGAALRIGPNDAAIFLNIVVLNAPPPPRDYISANNKDLLHRHAPHLTRPDIDSCYERMIRTIEAAMRADRIGPRWPAAVVHPARRTARAAALLAEKTLTSELIKGVLYEVRTPARPVLRRLVETGAGPVSNLHKKMLEGGAPDNIIFQARNLQANARYEHLKRVAQGRPTDDVLLTDLHERICTHATAKVALHTSTEEPAVRIWSDLLDVFETRAASIDPSNILQRDPMLLLGEACELSDRCAFGWGTVDHAD
jgi:hypothetical protein